MSQQLPVNKPRFRGFTLLEMVAVMAIVALMAWVVVPRLNPGTSAPELRALTYQAAILLRGARLSALQSRSPETLVLDTASRKIFQKTNTTNKLDIPRDVAIQHELSSRCIQNGDIAEIVFLPDGRSCGSQVTLSIDGATGILRTDWLAGKTKVSFQGL